MGVPEEKVEHAREDLEDAILRLRELGWTEQQVKEETEYVLKTCEDEL